MDVVIDNSNFTDTPFDEIFFKEEYNIRRP